MKTRTVKHPHTDATITFNPDPHIYTDNEGIVYPSVTALVKSAFAEFDTKAISEKCARVSSKTAEELAAEWKAKGDAAAAFGTRLHANVEAVLTGQEIPHPPTSKREITAFKIANETARSLKERFGNRIEAEKIVFSPFYRVAGTIDVPASTDDQSYFLFDWKTNENLKRENKYQSSIIPALSHIEDCALNHYSLQLSLYEMILRREAYIPEAATVRRFLIWIGPDEPEFIETADMQHEVTALLLEYWLQQRIMGEWRAK